MKTDTNSPILTVPQIAELFGIEETTAQTWARKQIIPAFKIGKNWFFNRAKVLEIQSYGDVAKHYTEEMRMSHTKLYDIFSKDGRLEVKSSRGRVDKKGQMRWRFSNLHNETNSDFHLFLGYNENHTELVVIYKIPSLRVKEFLTTQGKAVVIKQNDKILEEYIVYSI